MAAIFDTVDEGLKRVTGILPANTQYVTTMFWVYFNAWPATGATRTFYMISNSAARNTESIIIAQDDTGKIYLNVAGTIYGGQVFQPGWHSIGLRRRSTLNFIDMDVDNDSSAVSNATITFNGWTFDEVYLGHDPRIPSGGVSHQVVYFREWAAFLSYTPEWNSPDPLETIGLDIDTPLHSDLLDQTSNHHDWTHVGGGTQTFTFIPDSREGSMGGWWRFSSVILPLAAYFHYRGSLVIIPYSSSGALGDLATVVIGPLESSAAGGVTTAASFGIYLRYTGVGGVSTELASIDPFPDPAIGNIAATARGPWCSPAHRLALSWKCSTYDSATSTYAADGFVKLYLDGSILLQAVDVIIPFRPLYYEYLIGVTLDTDRQWARTVSEIAETDDDGAFVGGTPSALVYYEEFDSNLPPGWARRPMYLPGGGGSGAANMWDDCGADGGSGLSTFAMGPTTSVAESGGFYAPWAGLSRIEKYPPIDLTTGGGGGEEPPPPDPPTDDPSGIYTVTPNNPNTPPPTTPGPPGDFYYSRVPPEGIIEKKIPDPTIKTALLGE